MMPYSLFKACTYICFVNKNLISIRWVSWTVMPPYPILPTLMSDSCRIFMCILIHFKFSISCRRDKLKYISFCTGPNGCAVLGVRLRPLACQNCGFESRRGHGCLSVVSVVYCQVEASATGRSLIQRSTTDGFCVTENDPSPQ